MTKAGLRDPRLFCCLVGPGAPGIEVFVKYPPGEPAVCAAGSKRDDEVRTNAYL